MVGGVYTEPASRNLGLGSAVCSALCAELLAEGKQPALYWQEPAAGVVYRKLGFQRSRNVAVGLATSNCATSSALVDVHSDRVRSAYCGSE